MLPTLLTALVLVLPPSKSRMLVQYLEDITTLGASHPHSFASCHSFTHHFSNSPVSKTAALFFFSCTSCAHQKRLRAGRTILDTVLYWGFFRGPMDRIF
jgi:hypothetical protein